MKRIEGQLQDEEVLAKQVLSWITCAKRPLSTSELEHAIAVKPGISKLDIDDICPVGDMVSVCAGLVTVDAKGGICLIQIRRRSATSPRCRSHLILNPYGPSLFSQNTLIIGTTPPSPISRPPSVGEFCVAVVQMRYMSLICGRVG